MQSFADRSICLHSPHQLLFQRRSLFRDSHLRRFSHPAPASCAPVPAADADNWHHLSAFAAGSRSRRVSAAAGGMDPATRQRCFRQLSEPLEPSDARHALELSDIQSLFHWHDLFQHSGDLCHALLSAKGIPVSRRYLWRDSGVSSAAVPHERHDVSGSQGVHSPAATAAVAVRILLEDLTVPPDCPAFHAAAVFRSAGYGYPVPDRNRCRANCSDSGRAFDAGGIPVLFPPAECQAFRKRLHKNPADPYAGIQHRDLSDSQSLRHLHVQGRCQHCLLLGDSNTDRSAPATQ